MEVLDALFKALLEHSGRTDVSKATKVLSRSRVDSVIVVVVMAINPFYGTSFR